MILKQRWTSLDGAQGSQNKSATAAGTVET